MEYLIQGDTLTGIADAIRSKTGKPGAINTDAMASEILSIQTGTNPVVEKDVNFYDYDGTLVYSYTLAEAQDLQTLPDGPAHDGLLFQGWNWSLEDVKALTTPMNVGANYITSDGITRAYLSIDKYFMANNPPEGVTVELYLYQNPRLGFTVRWGDGESTTAGTDSFSNTVTHVYKDPGEYTIEIEVPEGAEIALGHSNSAFIQISGQATNPIVKKVELGKGVVIWGYSFLDFHAMECLSITSNPAHDFTSSVFRSNYRLKAVIIPDGVSNIGTSCFLNNKNLRILSLPSSVTTLNNYCFQLTALDSALLPDSVNSVGISAFNDTRNIKMAIIPDGLSAIKSQMFSAATCLTRIDIPSSVSSIEDNAFYNCSSLFQVVVRSANPPNLQNENAFRAISDSCLFYVPRDSVETYKQATNWTVYADRIRAIEDYPEIS